MESYTSTGELASREDGSPLLTGNITPHVPECPDQQHPGTRSHVAKAPRAAAHATKSHHEGSAPLPSHENRVVSPTQPLYTPEDLAERQNLKRQVVKGNVEWHGANPSGSGASTNGYILNEVGTSWDRFQNRHYTSGETAVLFGIAPEQYAPVCQWRDSNGYTRSSRPARVAPVPHPKLSPAKANPKPPVGEKAVRRVEFDYCDETGTLLYQCVRLEYSNGAKTFWQRRPDGQGGWHSNLDDTRCVLYRLPEVRAASTVFLVEGEKCADVLNGELEAARLRGSLIATTNSQGAGKWSDSYSQELEGKHVVVLPDNDAPGRRHTDTACPSIQEHAASLQFLELPDLPEKGDVCNFFNAGGTLNHLLALARDAPAWCQVKTAEDTFEDSAKPPYEIFTLREMTRLPRPEWLVRDLLVEKTVSVLSADSSAFKTFIALHFALCIVTGHPCFGREVKQGAAVYVAAEGFYTLLDRARAWAQEYGYDLPENLYILRAPVNVADEATVKAFADHIESLTPVVVFLDTLSQCAIGANENDNSQMADFVRGMMAVGRRIGAHVQTLHHNAKSTGTLRGAGAIKANVDTHITLERPQGDTDNTVFVRCDKQRGKPFDAFSLRGQEVVLPDQDEFGEPITSLVFKLCGDGAVSRPEKHPNAARADKTRMALLALFDSLAAERDGGVKIGTWKGAVEDAKPPICGESTFWRYVKALKQDAIEPCGEHGGSELYQRRGSTLTTPTTLKTSCESESPSSEAPHSHNSLDPLGERVVRVESGRDGSHDQGQQTALFPSPTPPRKTAPISIAARSEAYATSGDQEVTIEI